MSQGDSSDITILAGHRWEKEKSWKQENDNKDEGPVWAYLFTHNSQLFCKTYDRLKMTLIHAVVYIKGLFFGGWWGNLTSWHLKCRYLHAYAIKNRVEMRKPNRTHRIISDGDIISRKFASFQIVLRKAANKRKGFFFFRHQSFKINEG